MAEGFFVSMDDLGLSAEEIDTLKSQCGVHTKSKLGLQLMRNIVKEILASIHQMEPAISEYAPERYDAFFCGEFNRLSPAEKHFLIMWSYQGLADEGIYTRLGNIRETRALQGYNMLAVKKQETPL